MCGINMKYLFIFIVLNISIFSCKSKIDYNNQKIIKNKIINTSITKENNCNLIVNINNLTCDFLKKCGFHMQLLDLDITLLQKKINKCKQKDKSFSKEWDKINMNDGR